MKKLKNLILAVLVLFSVQLFAQTAEYETEAELVESVVGKARKDFVVDMVDIPNDKTEKFWKIYNDFEEDRRDLARDQVKRVNDYLSMVGMATEKQEGKFMNKVFSDRKKYEELMRKYYRKLDNEVSSKTAIQFFHVQEYINAAVDTYMYENLPMNR